MSLLEQQSALARLLTDPEFRQRFLAEPDRAGRELGLNEGESEDVASVAELESFADSLIWKRLREVEKILPITSQAAGDEFRLHFFRFAPAFNPQTVRKHYEDAIAFSRFIEAQDLPGPVRDAARLERTRAAFFAEGRILSCCLSRYDLAAGGEGPKLRKRAAIAVWLRLGKGFRHFII